MPSLETATHDLFRLTRPFAPFGRSVSRLGLGGAVLGIDNYLGVYAAAEPGTRDAAVATVRLALDQGVTYFDTAPSYGDGLSESIFGEALAGRSDVVVATKVSMAAAADVRASAEASLQRLRRDRLDLLQIHGGSLTEAALATIMGPGGMLAQMLRLRDEGLVTALGFTSEDNNPAVYTLIESGAFDTMQLSYNFIQQHPYEPTKPFGSLLKAREHGLFTVAMRSTTAGIFQKWLQAVNPDNTFDYTPALIQFVLSNPLIDVALVGMRTPSDVASCAEIWRDEAGRIDIAELWARWVR